MLYGIWTKHEREVTDIGIEMRIGFSETQAMIKFSRSRCASGHFTPRRTSRMCAALMVAPAARAGSV